MIAIRDFKMPSCCYDCDFSIGVMSTEVDRECTITEKYVNDDDMPDWCPLVYVPDEAGNCSEIPNNSDCVSRQKVKFKLCALVNEIEEIFSHIRERNEDDSVCGLCEYDGAYIGQSGDWYNECPGFDKADCFKLKDKYREEWLSIDG